MRDYGFTNLSFEINDTSSNNFCREAFKIEDDFSRSSKMLQCKIIRPLNETLKNVSSLLSFSFSSKFLEVFHLEFLCHLLLTLYPSARSQYFVPDTVSFVCMNGRFGGTKTTIVMLVGLLLVGGSCLQKCILYVTKGIFQGRFGG